METYLQNDSDHFLDHPQPWYLALEDGNQQVGSSDRLQDEPSPNPGTSL